MPNDHGEQIRIVQETVAGKEITAAWNQLRQGTMQLSSDGVLLTTVLWDQMTPYNNLCPVVNSQRTPLRGDFHCYCHAIP